MTNVSAWDVALPAEVNDEEVEAKQRKASVRNRASLLGFSCFVWPFGRGVRDELKVERTSGRQHGS